MCATIGASATNYGAKVSMFSESAKFRGDFFIKKSFSNRFPRLYQSRRVTTYNRISGKILAQHAAGGYNRAVRDVSARRHQHIAPYPHIVAYNGRLAFGIALHHHWRVEVVETMVGTQYVAIGSHHHIIAYHRIGGNMAIRPDAAVITYDNPCSQTEKCFALYVYILAGFFENATAHRSPQTPKKPP